MSAHDATIEMGRENHRREYEEMMLRLKARQPQVDDKLRRAWGVPEWGDLDRPFDEVWAEAGLRADASLSKWREEYPG